jgi:hypothetical protein
MTLALPSIAAVQQALVGQKAEIAALKGQLTDMESRLRQNYDSMMVRLLGLPNSPDLAKIKDEVLATFTTNLQEIANFRVKLNALLGTGSHLADIRHKGRRPMWTCLAEVMVAAGTPLTVDQITDLARSAGYKFTGNIPENRATRQCLDAQPRYFRKVGKRGDAEPVRYEVIPDSLPSPEDVATTVGGTVVEPPAVAGTPV